jgi:hypothetical protein
MFEYVAFGAEENPLAFMFLSNTSFERFREAWARFD